MNKHLRPSPPPQSNQCPFLNPLKHNLTQSPQEHKTEEHTQAQAHNSLSWGSPNPQYQTHKTPFTLIAANCANAKTLQSELDGFHHSQQLYKNYKHQTHTQKHEIV
eukprot:m.27927 g.27927  ORF g.27927 m.27927 type:complete len:106 (+) comp9409_c0_seq5:1676-1993(+)